MGEKETTDYITQTKGQNMNNEPDGARWLWYLLLPLMLLAIAYKWIEERFNRD